MQKIQPSLCFANILSLSALTPQNGQTHSTTHRQIADELFECLTILWGWHLKG